MAKLRPMTKLLELVGDAPVASFAKGETILRQGDPVDRIYVLREGGVHITKDGTSICSIDRPGSAFGEIATLLDIRSTATVTTNRESTFAVIENPLDSLRHQPAITLELAKLLAHRLRWLTMTYSEEIDDGESVFWASR